jgi:succinyl-diaminopimelate desuccinylase
MSHPASLTDPFPLAQALIRCPSITPADAGALAVLEAALSPLGFTCHRLTFGADHGRPPIENLYARLGEDGPNLCFAGHTDVVPVGGGWTVDPFAGQVIDQVLYGRGAADMKGAIACFVAAVARLLSAGPLPGSISLLITGDEEGRGLDGTARVLDWLRERGERLDFCVVGEPTSQRRLGETIKIGRRGSLNARLRVSGTQGHAAYPQLADNPIPRLLDMLRAITAEPLDRGSACFEPSTLAITTIDVGNPVVNITPAAVRAGFNIRFNDLHSGNSLETWLRQRFDAIGGAYDLEVEVSGESFLTPDGPLVDALADAVVQVTGHAPELSTSGGTSDARFIKNVCPVAEFGLVGQTMHKADERVAIADLEDLTRIYALAATRILSMPC